MEPVLASSRPSSFVSCDLVVSPSYSTVLGSVLKRNSSASAAIVESKCSNDIDDSSNLFSRWNLECDEDSSLLVALSPQFTANAISKVLLILVSIVLFSLLLWFAWLCQITIKSHRTALLIEIDNFSAF